MNRLNIPSPRLHQGEEGEMAPASIHRPRPTHPLSRSDPIRSPHLHFDDGRRRYRIPLKFARPAGGTRDVRRNPIPLQNCPICLRGTPPPFFGTGGRSGAHAPLETRVISSMSRMHSAGRSSTTRERERDVRSQHVEATGRSFLHSRSLEKNLGLNRNTGRVMAFYFSTTTTAVSLR